MSEQDKRDPSPERSGQPGSKPGKQELTDPRRRDTFTMDNTGAVERKRPAVATAVNYQEPSQSKRTSDWLLRLFALFSDLSYSTELETPALVTRVERPAPLGRDTNDRSSLEGSISTSSWQLTVRLIGNRIVGYLYPLGGAHGVSDLGESKPLFTFESKESGGERDWYFEDKKIAFPQLPTYARRFFNKLITVSYSPAGPNDQPATDMSQFDSIDEERVLTLIENISAAGGSLTNSEPEAQPEPEMKPSEEPSTLQTPRQSSQPEELDMVMTEELTVAMARKQMERAVEKEQEAIIQLGKTAFENSDWDVVNRAMKKAQLMKDYKEKVFSVLAQWEDIEREIGQL